MNRVKRLHEGIEAWELEAYLDGQADPEVQEHVAQCMLCQSQVAAYRALDRQLTQRLYRFNCPSLDQLRDFCGQMVSLDIAAGIARHLDLCPHCQTETAALRRVRAALLLQPAPRSPAREWWSEAKSKAEQVRTIVAQVLAPAPRPAFALRGVAVSNLVYQAEDMLVAINPVGTMHGYVLTGQVLTANQETWANARACLLDTEGNSVAVASLDETCSFALPDVSAGRWAILIRGDKIEIVLPEVNI